MTTKEELKAAQEICKAEIKELQKKLKSKTQDYFEISVKPIFEKYPKLKSFGWTQYTPYFNDGDPCQFSVNAYPGEMYINGEFQDDLTADDLEMSSKEIKAIGNATYEVVKSMDNDSLESMFGEGKIVVSCTNGKLKVVTEEYDHD